MINVHVTSTFPVWISLSFLIRVTDEMVLTAYCLLHPLAVTTSLRRSVYALGSAYGVTRPLRPSRLVAATSHFTSFGANGSFRRSSTSAIYCAFDSMFYLLSWLMGEYACWALGKGAADAIGVRGHRCVFGSTWVRSMRHPSEGRVVSNHGLSREAEAFRQYIDQRWSRDGCGCYTTLRCQLDQKAPCLLQGCKHLAFLSVTKYAGSA